MKGFSNQKTQVKPKSLLTTDLGRLCANTIANLKNDAMKIAATQLRCTVGEISQNLDKHYQMIETAIEENIQLITFPEMSMTGYCREEAEKLAFTKDDHRLFKLKELAHKGKMMIIVGAPVRVKKELYIGAFIIYPDRSTDLYTKQYLHDGEELFFASSMNYNPIIDLEGEKISLAICADISQEQHPHQAKQNKSTLYLPSIFYSKNGIDEGHEQLRKYAEKYALNILMSNYSGTLWNITSGGKSAFWDAKGKLIDHLDLNDSGMLIAEKKTESWQITKLTFSLT